MIINCNRVSVKKIIDYLINSRVKDSPRNRKTIMELFGVGVMYHLRKWGSKLTIFARNRHLLLNLAVSTALCKYNTNVISASLFDELRVGDTVLIKPDLIANRTYNGCLCLSFMPDWGGTTAKVIESRETYKLDVTGVDCFWSNNMLYLLKRAE